MNQIFVKDPKSETFNSSVVNGRIVIVIFSGINEDEFLSVVDGRFENILFQFSKKVRIFFRLVIENPRSPGNSCCNCCDMNSNAPVPYVFVRLLSEMYSPTA